MVDHELRLYGHRGASVRLPENTLAAFRQALDDGANALELDVHQTSDGHLVVAHDADGRRTAATRQAIRDSTLEQVSAWNVGSGLATSGRHPMPTLDEVLATFPNVPISVDLKPRDPSSVPELFRLIAEHNAERRVTVGSFHASLVYLMRRLGYSGPTALTRGEVATARLLPKALCRRLIRGQAALIPRRAWGFRLDGRRFIRRCRALGLRVDFWVVNDPAEARALLEQGATGIMSDDPRRIAPVIRSQGASRGAS